MPYNTRRKSLSLTELGITLPKRSRTHSQSSPSHANNTNTNSNTAQGDEPPTKKSKRASSPAAAAASSHQTETKSPVRKSVTTIRFKEEAGEKKHNTPSGGAHQQQQQQQQQLSPPPSPVAEGARANRVDVEGINDDIVVATIRQLEQTGNRPHLVKELAAILSGCLDSAEKYDYPASSSTSFSAMNSAIAQSGVIDDEEDIDDDDRRRQQNANEILNRSTNPSALISSRLTAYINRPWPAVCPCPLAKDLTTAHPRRLYFYLTTLPRQPLPPSIATLGVASGGSKSSGNKRRHNGTISPSLSSAENSSLSSAASASDDVSDDAEHDALLMRQRQALSPSPEVDLSSPDLYDEAGGSDHPDQPGAPFSGRSSVDPNPGNSSGFDGSGSSVGGRAGSGGTRGLRGASPQLENEERDFKRVATAVYEEEMRRRQRSRSATEGVKTEDVVEGGAVVKKEQEGSPSGGGNSMIARMTTEGANGASFRSSPSSSSSSSAATSSEKMDVEMSDSNNPSSEEFGSISSTIENGTHTGSIFNTMEAEDDGEDASTEHQRQNREAAAALFGSEHLQHSPEMRSLGFFYGGSSPVIAPRDAALGQSMDDNDEGCEIGGAETSAGKTLVDEEGSLARSTDVDEVEKESSMGIESGHNDDDKMGISTHGNGSTDIEHGTTAASTKSLLHHGPIARTAPSPTKYAPNTSHEDAKRKDLNVMVIDSAADQDAAMRAEVEADDWAKSLQSPETVELEELEDLFDAY